MPNYAESVSTISLLVSLGTLGWTMSRAVRDQPRIMVRGDWLFASQGFPMTRSNSAWELTVQATNDGDKPVTLTYVGWLLMLPMGDVLVSCRPSHIGGRPGEEAEMTFPPTEPEEDWAFPRRLEAHDTRTWTIRIPMDAARWEGVAAVPIARFAKRRGLFDKSNHDLHYKQVVGEWQTLNSDLE